MEKGVFDCCKICEVTLKNVNAERFFPFLMLSCSWENIISATMRFPEKAEQITRHTEQKKYNKNSGHILRPTPEGGKGELATRTRGPKD